MPHESAPRLRVLVLDDHAVVVEGVRSILASRGHAISGAAKTLTEAMGLLSSTAPDVVICELDLVDGSGLELVRAARERALPALVLSVHEVPMFVHEAMRAGARGYLPKSAPAEDVIEAVEALADGRTHFSRRMIAAAERSRSAADGAAVEPHNLTRREVEVLRRVASGRTTRQIGQELHISPRTVETHRERLMTKLGVNNAAGLTRMAIQLGVLSTVDLAPLAPHPS